MRHIFYTIYGYTYHAVMHERIGPVRLLEIPLRMKEHSWSEYYLIVPANQHSIQYHHADQDDQGNCYQRLIHNQHGGWVTSKEVAQKLLRETYRHPERFRRIDGTYKTQTRDFARAA